MVFVQVSGVYSENVFSRNQSNGPIRNRFTVDQIVKNRLY